jgi:leucyl-tRNA synthetase
MWQELGEKKSIAYAPLPPVDPAFLIDETAMYVIQINGKLRGRIELPKDQPEEALLQWVRQQPEIEKFLTGPIAKTVFVPNKLLNIVLQ